LLFFYAPHTPWHHSPSNEGPGGPWPRVYNVWGQLLLVSALFLAVCAAKCLCIEAATSAPTIGPARGPSGPLPPDPPAWTPLSTPTAPPPSSSHSRHHAIHPGTHPLFSVFTVTAFFEAVQPHGGQHARKRKRRKCRILAHPLPANTTQVFFEFPFFV